MTWYKRSAVSLIHRVQLSNSSTGVPMTGLTSASSGLRIATIASNEASTTAYTSAGGTIEGITTLGTYAAPTAGKCRFKEVDSVSHPGLYELQFADARYAVANSLFLDICVSGVASLLACALRVALRTSDPDNLSTNVDKVNNSAAAAVMLGAVVMCNARFTVGAGSTVTSVVTSACTPQPGDLDQFKGQVIAFDQTTTTVALRGKKGLITGSTNATPPTLTIQTGDLITAPVSGDTGTIV